ncbi:MAG: hypothetical protein C5B51_21845 [Terriglobia bacterium]|nr:MAG: hypothetical protein C5B51_21845 [Terriglobia bacterium]
MLRTSALAYGAVLFALAFWTGPGVKAQTTDSVVRGRIIDSSTGRPLEGVRISYYNLSRNDSGDAHTGPSGYYVLNAIPAGNYRIRIEHAGFQSREIYGLDVFVASSLELNADLHPLSETLYATPGAFALRPGEAVLPTLGPDFEMGRSAPLDVPVWTSATLQSALSYAIDPQQTGELPLAARNVYTMIVTVPGVTAEEVTGRGLGLAVNGQRPSSSNFLLDGAQNNDYMLTGPYSTIPPEGIQEYRVTTNGFSAEYGGSAGFVANAITRSGTNAWHGLAYTYLNNDVLNAATFVQNAFDIRKTPQKELEAGAYVGGPIRKDRLFFSSEFDRYRSRALTDPDDYIVPVVANFRACAAQAGADFSAALKLFAQYPPQPAYKVLGSGSPCDSPTGRAQLTRPVSIDRTTALGRLDYRPSGGGQRFLVRLTGISLGQPKQVYNAVYPTFSSDMIRRSGGVAVTYTRSISAGLLNHAHASFRAAAFEFERPGGAAPGLFLILGGGLDLGGTLLNLPGSVMVYGFTSHEGDWEVADHVTWTRGSHVLSAGAGTILRRSNLNMPLLTVPWFAFANIGNFALGAPRYFVVGVSREALHSGRLEPAQSQRHYSNNQVHGFVQESWRVTPRFTVNLGARYESFGTLRNTGVPEGEIQLGSGQTVEQRLEGATVVFPHGGQSYYPSLRNNWAVRFGAAYSLSRSTVFRAGYGIFYDRPYDNLFLNPFNGTAPVTICVQTSQAGCVSGIFDYTQPVTSLLAGREPAAQNILYQALLWVDPNLRTPYVQNWFAGFQQHVTDRWYLEVSHAGGISRELITNDIVNRPVTRDNPSGRINPSLPDLTYRSNSGSSNYAALGTLAHYRSSLAEVQVSYTWSHSIDNQSDPLLLDPFSLTRFNPENPGAAPIYARFSRQFDSRIDRGSSDFDIRHNLTFYSVWRLPAVRRGWVRRFAQGWQFAQLASFRTGLPYSIYYNAGDPDQQTRPNLVPGVQPEVYIPVPGGVQLINQKAFSAPARGTVGNLGRNSFTGPGYWNVDFSVAKSFALAPIGETARLQIRADAFNVLNHANLGQPYPGSGIAAFGPIGSAPAFPAVTPLYPSSRRIQLQAKLYF